jgi:hypothetical protein
MFEIKENTFEFMAQIKTKILKLSILNVNIFELILLIFI